jgi:hypothetical protein
LCGGLSERNKCHLAYFSVKEKTGQPGTLKVIEKKIKKKTPVMGYILPGFFIAKEMLSR